MDETQQLVDKKDMHALFTNIFFIEINIIK